MRANVRFVSDLCLRGFAAGICVFGAAAAQSESIAIDGVYAARADIPAQVEVILIDRFRGDLGQDTEIALNVALGGVFIRGEPFFNLIRPGAVQKAVVEMEGQDGTVSSRLLQPDAELRGTVRSEVTERDIEPRIDRKCTVRDGEGECTGWRETRVQCRELRVQVEPRILLSTADGRQLYSQSTPRSQAARYCADDGSIPSSLGMANEMIDALVADIRNDLAPREFTRNIRVMERRRDLRREDRDTFRDAVRGVEENVEEACAGFFALEETNPDHVSVLFNIGLCLEWNADLNGAEFYYRRALELDPGRDYPSDGLRRLTSRRKAEAILAQRDY